MDTEFSFDNSPEAWKVRSERLEGHVLRELMLLDDKLRLSAPVPGGHEQRYPANTSPS